MFNRRYGAVLFDLLTVLGIVNANDLASSSMKASIPESGKVGNDRLRPGRGVGVEKGDADCDPPDVAGLLENAEVEARTRLW